MSSNLVINALKVLFVNILCFFIFQNAIYSTSLNGLPKACPMRNGQGLRSGKLSLRPLAIDVQQCSGTSNISWVNPKNTSYADDLYTELNLSPGAASECLWLHNFDLNIPDGSTIYGLGLEIEGHTTSSGITPVLIQLTDKNTHPDGCLRREPVAVHRSSCAVSAWVPCRQLSRLHRLATVWECTAWLARA